MTEERYSHIIKSIMAMDHLVHGFNGEEWVESWLINGVPDGLDGRDDYESAYPMSDNLEDDYTDLTALFCRLIARQVVFVEMPKNPEEYKIAFNGGNIII